MTKVRVVRCEFPWRVTIDFERMISYSMRTAFLKWCAENVGRGNFQMEDEMGATMIIRFREEGDAVLLKLRYENAHVGND